MSYPVRRDPFDDFFRGFLVRPLREPGGDAPEMRVDVKEQDQQYVVHADIPGMNKEDIHVRMEGATLLITAERHQEKEVKEGERVLRTERSFGRVTRSFDLGHEVDESKATARYADGVLELLLPKKAVAPTKRLVIN